MHYDYKLQNSCRHHSVRCPEGGHPNVFHPSHNLTRPANFLAHPSERALWGTGLNNVWNLDKALILEQRHDYYYKNKWQLSVFNCVNITYKNGNLKESVIFFSYYVPWQVVSSFFILLFIRVVIATTWFNKITTLGKMKNCTGLKVLEAINPWTSINFKCGISLRPTSRNSYSVHVKMRFHHIYFL